MRFYNTGLIAALNFIKHKIFCFILLFIILSSYNITSLIAQEKMRVAVLDLAAQGISQRIALTVSDLLRTELVNSGQFTVIERAQMKSILDEQGFQQTGCTDQECAVQLGKLISARKMLVGSVSPLGNAIVLNVRIVDVEKGVVDFAAKEKAESESGLDVAVESIVRKLTNKTDLPVIVREPPAPPLNVKASNNEFSDKILITWSASARAQEYYIYRSTSEQGGYVELYNTRDTSFSDKKIVPGVIYFYSVKARTGNFYSAFSATASGYANKVIVEVKNKPEIKKEYIPSNYPFVATVSPVFLMPIGDFSDVVDTGKGAIADVAIENVLVKGIRAGISAGYWRFNGATDRVESSYMIPALLKICYSLPLIGSFNLVPEINAGGVYSSVEYVNKDAETATKTAFEMLFMAGLSIEYSFNNRNAIQLGANYGMINESSGTMNFALLKAGLLFRFL